MFRESARFAFSEIPSSDNDKPFSENLKPLSGDELRELRSLGGANAAEREKSLAIFSTVLDDIRTLELSARERREIIGEVHEYKIKKEKKVETIDMKVKPMLANFVSALKRERELIKNEVMEANKKQQRLNEVKDLLALIYEKRPDTVRGLRHADEVFKSIFTPQILSQLKDIFESRYRALHEDEKKYTDLSKRAISNVQ